MSSQNINYEHIYIAIDLKSFYASVECRERGLNPLTTNLVVADSSRTEKTICLAVSPSLKQYGIPGRARLYEVVQKVKEINLQRKLNSPNHTFTCTSYDDIALRNNNDLELAYIVAPPRMKYYMAYHFMMRVQNILIIRYILHISKKRVSEKRMLYELDGIGN